MIKLYTQRHDAVTLNDALPAFTGQTFTGFCMTPAKFVFAQWNGNLVETANGIDLAQVYEARFFNESGELRWLRDPATEASGTAVWIAEAELELAGWEKMNPVDVESLPDSQRLFTGILAEPHETLTAWSWTNAPRQGKVALPFFGGKAGRRLAYMVREYLGDAPGCAGQDGNKMVIEERIVGIVLAEGVK